MRVVLDGERLENVAAVYQALAPAIGFPSYFGANPDALWDVLTERCRIDLEIVWCHAARSAARLGTDYQRLASVLRAAADAGLLSFEIRLK
jgi:RNAse (barnase) inhibitor barstar